MRCSACGFENTPGVTACGVCASQLGSNDSPRDVTPPRARDRSLRSSLQWEAERTGLRRAPLPRPDSIRRGFLAAASLVPGTGAALAKKGRRQAWLQAGSGLAFLALAVLLYRTRLSDVAIVGACAISVWSMVQGWDALFPASRGTDAEYRRVGLTLIAVAVLAGSYTLTRLVLSYERVLWTAEVLQTVPSEAARQGDTVLVRPIRGNPNRGDIVIAGTQRTAYPELFGPIVGIPGDTISVGTPVRVNGRSTIASVPEGGDVQLHLGEGEYWIQPFWQGNAAEARGALAGMTTRDGITGRAVAIVYPHARRARIHSENVYARGE